MKTRTMTTIALLCLAALAAGCTHYTSAYAPRSLAAGELGWAYHDRFQVTRDGHVIAEAGDWGGLPSAVSCVPRAGSWASSAAARDRRGKLLTWAGAGLMLAGMIGGGLIVASDTSDTDTLLLGGGAMLGGVVVGGTGLVGGFVQRARAEADAIDAVNLYNDERPSETACAR